MKQMQTEKEIRSIEEDGTYKPVLRKKLMEADYKIILNIGDSLTDFSAPVNEEMESSGIINIYKRNKFLGLLDELVKASDQFTI